MLIKILYAIRYHRLDDDDLIFIELAPLAHGEVEFDVHDADAFECGYAVIKEFAHPANLPIEPLRQDNPKGEGIDLPDVAAAGFGT